MSKENVNENEKFVADPGWGPDTMTIFFLKDPIYLQSVTIHSANGGKGEGWHVEEYSVDGRLTVGRNVTSISTSTYGVKFIHSRYSISSARIQDGITLSSATYT
jgi:hypothetical protein